RAERQHVAVALLVAVDHAVAARSCPGAARAIERTVGETGERAGRIEAEVSAVDRAVAVDIGPEVCTVALLRAGDQAVAAPRPYADLIVARPDRLTAEHAELAVGSARALHALFVGHAAHTPTHRCAGRVVRTQRPVVAHVAGGVQAASERGDDGDGKTLHSRFFP